MNYHLAIDRNRKYSQYEIEKIAKMLLDLEIADRELFEGIDYEKLRDKNE